MLPTMPAAEAHTAVARYLPTFKNENRFASLYSFRLRRPAGTAFSQVTFLHRCRLTFPQAPAADRQPPARDVQAAEHGRTGVYLRILAAIGIDPCFAGTSVQRHIRGVKAFDDRPVRVQPCGTQVPGGKFDRRWNVCQVELVGRHIVQPVAFDVRTLGPQSADIDIRPFAGITNSQVLPAYVIEFEVLIGE